MPQEAIVRDASLLKEGDLVKTVLEKGAFVGLVKEVIKDGQRKTSI